MSGRSLLVGLVGLGGLVLACRAVEPSNRPIETCKASCMKRASRQCSESGCERGCEFIIDRIIEREGPNVVACVGRQTRGCGDVVWAECAAHVGAHADGGPPPPPPPSEEWE
jgi:hypothetical protein